MFLALCLSNILVRCSVANQGFYRTNFYLYVLNYVYPSSLAYFSLAGQAFALFPYHPITSCFAWLITPISSRFGFVRRSLLRYSAHGLLRDKKSTLIETRSGPHSAVSSSPIAMDSSLWYVRLWDMLKPHWKQHYSSAGSKSNLLCV